MLITFGLIECYYINLNKDEFRKSCLLYSGSQDEILGHSVFTNHSGAAAAHITSTSSSNSSAK